VFKCDSEIEPMGENQALVIERRYDGFIAEKAIRSDSE
jgi:hypothetical protein